MLGHVLVTHLSSYKHLQVFMTVRNEQYLNQWFSKDLISKCRYDVDAYNFLSIIKAINDIQPDIVINCIGIIKQSPLAKDPNKSIIINSMLPRRLSMVCRAADIRLIQISTDCIFNGSKGNYKEDDDPDAEDIYGMTKLLGVVNEVPHVTIRTSIIGHELRNKLGLIEWFLAEDAPVKGYTRAIFSGFPTIEFAKILHDCFLANPNLRGLYHVSSDPISKYDLLNLVREKYGKAIEIIPDDQIHLDRSLDSKRFRKASGYIPPAWPILVERMYDHYVLSPNYHRG